MNNEISKVCDKIDNAIFSTEDVAKNAFADARDRDIMRQYLNRWLNGLILIEGVQGENKKLKGTRNDEHKSSL